MTLVIESDGLGSGVLEMMRVFVNVFILLRSSDCSQVTMCF